MKSRTENQQSPDLAGAVPEWQQPLCRSVECLLPVRLFESMDLEVVGRLILKMPRYFLPYLASANVERRGTSRTGLPSAKKRKRGTP